MSDAKCNTVRPPRPMVARHERRCAHASAPEENPVATEPSPPAQVERPSKKARAAKGKAGSKRAGAASQRALDAAAESADAPARLTKEVESALEVSTAKAEEARRLITIASDASDASKRAAAAAEAARITEAQLGEYAAEVEGRPTSEKLRADVIAYAFATMEAKLRADIAAEAVVAARAAVFECTDATARVQRILHGLPVDVAEPSEAPPTVSFQDVAKYMEAGRVAVEEAAKAAVAAPPAAGPEVAAVEAAVDEVITAAVEDGMVTEAA